MVSSSEILDIIELIFYTPVLLVSLYVCKKHGFSRESGWLLITILSAVRIAGAATGIAGLTSGDQSVLIASLVLSSIGSATLVAALTAITNRIESGSRVSHIPPRIRKALQLMTIVAIAMGAVGGSKVADSDPASRADGYTYLQVAAVLIFVQYLVTAYLLAMQLTHMRRVLDTDRHLCIAATAAAPFIFVRTIYSLVSAFDHNSPALNSYSRETTAIVLRGVLGVAMEIIATTFLLVGGIVAPKMEQRETAVMEGDTHLEPYRGHKDQAVPPRYNNAL